MKITVLTIFDEFFTNFLSTSIIKNAIDNKLVKIEIVDFRQFSKNKFHKVDDTPYGGGPGMVLALQPIVDAINHYKTALTKTILLTPSGKRYDQQLAYNLKDFYHLILICGHYEGFDERINNYIDLQISIGDYILTGGEIAAMVLMDSIIRLIPNVISKSSLVDESFENNLLDYPNYTKPANFNGYQVPEVLLNGHHQKINKFRFQKQLEKTQNHRIDLYKKYLEKG
ncbi:MAG: tRNA (guanosine(37)-N1)-methyltransferase TrmD [Malacoplasma sp.]|nr:tRNA (guanosine(37)-N1)-methyltransferase TrmD [Malacoplasma sp.]